MIPVAPLIGIARHRLATDGQGVTTLVAFHGCPLRCRYCLNPQCLEPSGIQQNITPQELLDKVRVDDLYFQATNGGICFGGGEPLLHSRFIADFCRLCPPSWHICMETSLSTNLDTLREVLPFVHHFYIDIKDWNPVIYQRYTTRSIAPLHRNLKWLAQNIDTNRITLRLPHIPDYNTPDDVSRSRESLNALGFKHFDELTYQT